MVVEWKSYDGTVWWNSGTVRVEQCRGTVMEELGGGTVELIVEQCGGTVLVEQCGGTVEQ